MFNLPERWGKFLSLLIAVIALIISVGILFIPIDSTAMTALGYGGIFLIALLSAASLFIPGPSMVATFTGGAVLNPLVVIMVAAFGSAIGEGTGYALGIGGNAITEGEWRHRIESWMRKYAFVTIFVLAAIPNFLTDLTGLIAGFIGYPFPRFFLATFLGKIVRFGISTYLGVYVSSSAS